MYVMLSRRTFSLPISSLHITYIHYITYIYYRYIPTYYTDFSDLWSNREVEMVNQHPGLWSMKDLKPKE